MNIFHISSTKEEKNLTFTFKINENNFIKCHTLKVLDSIDLYYFTEILYQFSNKNLPLNDNEDNWES